MNRAYLLVSIAALATGVLFFVHSESPLRISKAAGPTIAVNLISITTLAAETAPNTSAATNFPGCETSTVTSGTCVNNGNLIASNVSKVNIHTLLPANHQSAKIYTTYIPFWGNSSHPNIGYSSTDPSQVAKEVADLTSRGFDGVVDDWYGQGSWEEQGAEVLKSALDKQSALTFSLMIDQGAIRWYSCYPTCSATQALQNTLAFARTQGYFSDPHYQTLNGKPIVHEFGLEAYSIDWQAIANADPDLQFIWENAGGFNRSDSAGEFAWLQPLIFSSEPSGYEGLNYLTNFYSTAATTSSKYIVGSAWKGFDDTVASWSPAPYNEDGVNGGRRIEQNCAETWLDTWNTIGSYNGRLDAMEVATWDDYEEGTEIQTGIDNCLAINSSFSGSTLSWTITGEDNTLDHYTVYISTDGKNLALLADNIAPSTRSLDLSAYQIPAGNYTLYIKAVGKPSIANHMSNGVLYSVAATPVCTAPTFKGGTVSATSVAPGAAYTITCDYGFVGPGIMPTVQSGNCTYTKFTGTAATFACTAGAATGTFLNACIIDPGNTANYCLVSNPIATLVVATTTISTTTTIATSTTGTGSGGNSTSTTGNSGTDTTSGSGSGATSGSSSLGTTMGASTNSGSSGGGGGGGSFYTPPPTQSTETPTSATSPSQAQLFSLLQSLFVELNALIAKLNASIVPQLTATLSIGSNNGQVLLLQELLNDNGYVIAQTGPGSPGFETAYFGMKTAAALRKYQTANGVAATGILDPTTKASFEARW